MKNEGTSWLVLAEKEAVPEFVPVYPEFVNLPEQVRLPEPPPWTTLYIGAGKKDKISKTDIVGFLIHKGNLNKEDVGLITVLDDSSFVAVNRLKIRRVINLIKDEKIKNKKVRIAISE